MSQRDSGYERVEHDVYETPGWVTQALVPHLKPSTAANSHVWEPAAASGKIVTVFQERGYDIAWSDIRDGQDFFKFQETPAPNIITNPPFNLATEFIEHALRLTMPVDGLVAMLLRTDFDHAKTRAHLFRNNWAFSKKLVLTKRIVWFERDDKPAQPSFNHAWFVWDWRNTAAPTLHYDVQ